MFEASLSAYLCYQLVRDPLLRKYLNTWQRENRFAKNEENFRGVAPDDDDPVGVSVGVLNGFHRWVIPVFLFSWN
jgi:hypothetical protein